MKSNHHTHTLFSDGKSHPEAYIQRAIELEFDILGFTEHSPLPFENTFSFKAPNKDLYHQTITGLRTKYSGQISIYKGMEVDYIPGMSEDFSMLRKEYELDFLIGSVHLVKPDDYDDLWFTDGPDYRTYDDGVLKLFGGDIRKAVTTYYHQVNSMIETQGFEIIGHFDKIKMHNRGRFFTEEEKWYQDLISETIGLIKEKELIVEVNTRGIYKKRSETTYPGLDILKEIRKRSIPVMVNSDAHLPHELDGEFTYAYSLLKQAGIRETIEFRNSGWSYVAIDGLS